MTAPTLVNDPWRRQGRTSNQGVGLHTGDWAAGVWGRGEADVWGGGGAGVWGGGGAGVWG